ncbi:MAG: HAD family hydrolase [Candidatus Melainabacteria bacterium]
MSIKLLWPSGSLEDCELIVFDKDGTIVDFYSVWLNMAASRAQWLADRLSSNSHELFSWRNRFLRAAGVDPESGDIDLSGPIVNLSFENQSYCLATLLHTNIPDKYSWHKALELTNESVEWALYHNDPASMSVPIPGAFEFIKALGKTKLVKLALITSDSTINAERTLERFDVKDLFSEIQGSDIHPSKPSPRALLNVCQKLGVSPEKTLVIGDAPNDIQMALGAKAKIICIEGIGSKEQLISLGANSTFSNWSELSFE